MAGAVRSFSWAKLAAAAWLGGLAACGGSGGGGAPATYTIGGTVTGLTGGGLALRNNGGDTLTIAANGAFTFATALAERTAYAVTVGTQPAGQHCLVANGSGTVGAGAVTSVAVTCGAPPLTLTNSAPANGATDVPRSATFALTFSADLDRATVTTANVTLASPAGTQTATLGGAGAQLTVVPTAPLRSALPYTLTIGTAVRGAGGEPVLAPIVVAVKSEDGAWGAETTISTSAASALAPKIAADAAGGAVAAWFETATGPWGARTDGTGVWAFTQPLGGTMISATHDVAVDGDGNGFVVWQHGTTPPFRVYASRFAVGGIWSFAVPIDAGVNAAGPAVAVNDAGTAIAIFSQVPRLYGNRYTTTGGWGLAEPAHALDTANIGSRFVGIDAAGNALAVWDSGLAPATQVNYARYVVGTGWSAFGQIPAGAGGGAPGAPQVVVDAAGNALAVWSQHDGVRGNLWASRFTPAGGWSAATALETTQNSVALSQLAGDRLGNAVAVFLQDDGVRNNVVANRYRVGSGWLGAEPLETSAADATNAVVAVDAGGNAHAAWLQGGALWISRYTVGGSWLAAPLVSGADQPWLAASATGRGYLVYAAPRTTSPFNRAVKVRQFD